jgi:hypothetical protein
MNCPTCNYALWNLRERRCPECGREFLPSEFSFVANAVRFCCPHCSQDYYGTDAKGHLEPPAFTCINCSRFITMDEMVLQPTEGVEEKRTKPDPMPWLEKTYGGFFRRWWGTVIRSMGTPGRLIEQTPAETSAGSALGFVAINSLLPGVLGFLLFGFMFMGVMFAGPGMFGLLGLVLPLLIAVFAVLIWVGLWTILSHLILTMMGGAQHGIRRTFHCIAFSSGPNLLTAIPCVAQVMAPLAWIWWVIGATLMLQRGQKAPAWKAATATIVPPALATVALVIGMVALFQGMQGAVARAQAAAAAVGGGAAPMRTQGVARALTNYLAEQGTFPAHAAELVADARSMPHEFTLVIGDMTASAENIGGMRLDQLTFASQRRQRQALDAAAANLPADVAAHRIGDFVFTYHGMSRQSHPGLWILMAAVVPQPAPQTEGEEESGDAAEQAGPEVEVHIATIAGVVQTITPEQFPEALAEQNALRAESGLAPLPHPLQVQRAWP